MPKSTAKDHITTPDGLITVPAGSPKILIHTRQGRCVGIYCDQPNHGKMAADEVGDPVQVGPGGGGMEMGFLPPSFKNTPHSPRNRLAFGTDSREKFSRSSMIFDLKHAPEKLLLTIRVVAG
jgi:hypothetical protein